MIESLKIFAHTSLYTRFIPEDPALDKNTEKAVMWHQVTPDNTDALEAAALKWNNEGYGCFFLVNQASGKGQRKENITHLTAFFIDADGGDIKDALEVMPLPTAVVNTSPGKYHMYWILKNPIPATEENIRIWSSVQERLALINSRYDTSMTDITQIMRIPGSMHHKATPYPVTLDPSSGGKYDFTALVEISKGLPIAQREGGSSGERFTGSSFRVLTDEDGLISEPGRHEHFMQWCGHTAMSVSDHGAMRAAALEYAERHFDGGMAPWLNGRSSELDRMIETALGTREKFVVKAQEARKEVALSDFDEVSKEYEDDEEGAEGEEGYPPQNYKQHPVFVAEEFCSRERSIIALHDRIYVYDGKCWGNSQKVWEPVINRLEKFIIDNEYNWIPVPGKDKKGEKYRNTQIRSSDLDEVMRKVKRQMITVAVPPAENTWLCDMGITRPSCIAVRNGILDLDTGELLPFTAAFFNMNTLPVSYDSTAVCPEWEATLDKFLAGDKQSIESVQKFFGYCLYPATYLKILMLFVGQKNTGKSFMSWVLSSILGQYCTSFSKQTIQSGFATAGMERAKLALVDDYDMSSITQSEVEFAKKVTSGAGVEIQYKGKDKFLMEVTARLLYTANSLPERFVDRMGAFSSRVRVIQTVEIEPEARVPLSEAKRRITAELPGILNWILRGVEALKKDDNINTPEMARAAHDTFRNSGRDVVEAFIEEMLVPKGGAFLASADIYSSFLGYIEREDWISEEDKQKIKEDNKGLGFQRQFKSKIYLKYNKVCSHRDMKSRGYKEIAFREL